MASYGRDNITTNRTIIRKQKCEEKQMYGYFKRQTGGTEEKNLKRETESFLTVAQNNPTKRTIILKRK